MNDINIFWGVWVVVRFRVGFNNLFAGFGETKGHHIAISYQVSIRRGLVGFGFGCGWN